MGKSRATCRFATLLQNELKSNVARFRDLSEISRGVEGGGNFKFGFGNEVTHPCNGSEIC